MLRLSAGPKSPQMLAHLLCPWSALCRRRSTPCQSSAASSLAPAVSWVHAPNHETAPRGQSKPVDSSLNPPAIPLRPLIYGLAHAPFLSRGFWTLLEFFLPVPALELALDGQSAGPKQGLRGLAWAVWVFPLFLPQPKALGTYAGGMCSASQLGAQPVSRSSFPHYTVHWCRQHGTFQQQTSCRHW